MSTYTPKETVYDERIAPLMTQIIDLCKEARINFFVTFALDTQEDDTPLCCTTAQPENDLEDEAGATLVDDLRKRALRGPTQAFAFTLSQEPRDTPKTFGPNLSNPW